MLKLIEDLKSLLSHKVIDGDLNQVLKEVLPLAIREIKIKKGLAKRTTPLKLSDGTSSMRLNEVTLTKKIKKVTRSIPTGIKRMVRLRDQGKCLFRNPLTNKICGSTFQLEFEHIRPWSFNGDHSVENIMTCCKNHNLVRWQKVERMNYQDKGKL